MSQNSITTSQQHREDDKCCCFLGAFVNGKYVGCCSSIIEDFIWKENKLMPA